jgi:two-component system chemotaxis response regulator CheB
MNAFSRPVRVLIVDDSALIRQLLTTVLSADPQIEVIGSARDPFEARERIKTLNPDVITLDVEMPKMDGLTFLRKVMSLRPMPVVMISTLTKAGADVTIEALEIGAVDFVAKPTHGGAEAMDELAEEIQAKVKAAAAAKPRGVRLQAPRRAAAPISLLAKRKVVAIGSSTGGVEALKTVLLNLPAECPPILVTQHMPPRFTASLAARLDRECPQRVHEAENGQPIEHGHVYIAPGGLHLELARRGDGFCCRVRDGDLVSGHRPSVDVLFRSMANIAGASGVGVILTGMGKDGAEGLLSLRTVGGVTLGQDAESSLVYGMPRAAHERGAVMRQVGLSAMADAILESCERGAAQVAPAAQSNAAAGNRR